MKKIEIIREKIIKEVVWQNDNMRKAIITYNVNDNKLIFDRCDFKGVGTTYSIDDWDFLKDLSVYILKDAKRNN